MHNPAFFTLFKQLKYYLEYCRLSTKGFRYNASYQTATFYGGEGLPQHYTVIDLASRNIHGLLQAYFSTQSLAKNKMPTEKEKREQNIKLLNAILAEFKDAISLGILTHPHLIANGKNYSLEMIKNLMHRDNKGFKESNADDGSWVHVDKRFQGKDLPKSYIQHPEIPADALPADIKIENYPLQAIHVHIARTLSSKADATLLKQLGVTIKGEFFVEDDDVTHHKPWPKTLKELEILQCLAQTTPQKRKKVQTIFAHLSTVRGKTDDDDIATDIQSVVDTVKQIVNLESKKQSLPQPQKIKIIQGCKQNLKRLQLKNVVHQVDTIKATAWEKLLGSVFILLGAVATGLGLAFALSTFGLFSLPAAMTVSAFWGYIVGGVGVVGGTTMMWYGGKKINKKKPVYQNLEDELTELAAPSASPSPVK